MADLIFDCCFGVSGDMIVGALLDLGASESVLINTLKSLNIDDYEIKISKINKNGTTATDFDVTLKEKNYDNDMSYLYGDKAIDMKIKLKRNLPKICEIIENSILSDRAKKIAIDIFSLVAIAEAKAHKIDTNEVIFHETGAMDSIIDIVSIAVCIDNLNLNSIFVNNLREGKGFIRTRVGTLPIPTPAVENVLNQYGVKIDIIDCSYELITPTGISAIAVLTNFKAPKANLAYKKIGYGAGKRDYNLPCTLKAILI